MSAWVEMRVICDADILYDMSVFPRLLKINEFADEMEYTYPNRLRDEVFIVNKTI